MTIMASGRRLVGVGVLGVALLVGAGAYFVRSRAPVLLAGPMVQRVEPDGFAVVWRATRTDGGRLTVEGPGGVWQVESRIEDGQQVARVAGLVPNTEYRYTVRQSRPLGAPADLATATVRTAKPPGEPIRFLVFGDSGSGSNSQFSLSRKMADYDYDFVLHTGDLIYPAGEREGYAERFFAPYAAMIRKVPFYPCLGNHDVMTEEGAPLLETFVLPENGPTGMRAERCYWFEYGDARFVALDSTLEGPTLREIVAPWLRQVLADAQTTWRILFFHHPPYSNSKYGPDKKIQETLGAVFEEGGVDLVFNGHAHLYERTKPLRAGKVVPAGEGVIYVVTGAGGNVLYHENPEPVDYIDAYNHDAHSFTLVQIKGSTLHLQQIGLGRNVIDNRGSMIDDWTYERPERP